jgi:hypothetical protein
MSHGKFYNKIYSSMASPGGYNVTLEKRFEGKGRTGPFLVLYFSSEEQSFKLSLFYSRFKKPIGGGLDFNKIPLGTPLWVDIGITKKGYPLMIDAEYGWRHYDFIT